MWCGAIPDLDPTPTPDRDTTPRAGVNSLTSAIIFTKGQATLLRTPEAVKALGEEWVLCPHGRRLFFVSESRANG